MEKLKDVTDFLTIIISRQDIENHNFSQTIGTLKLLLENKKTIECFFERVEIGVGGYDNDSRELWEIPEVKLFIQKLDIQFPYWFYFLTKFGSGLKMIAYCCNNLIKISSTQVWIEPHSLEQFYNKHFVAMNQLGDKIGMTNKENEELTEMVLGYFL